jgi:NADH-quinone oxidoreductase subunit C
MADKSFEDALHGLETGASADAASAAPVGEPADAASHPSVVALRDRFGDAILHHTVAGIQEHVVYIEAGRNVEILGWLKDDEAHRYELLLDVTAVDYGGGRPLEVVYQLISVKHRRTLRLKVALPLTMLEIDSVAGLWNTANWLEREAYDMFGIRFRNHPDLRRILMPNNYAEGHPLRKDFPLRGRFSRAEQTRRALSMAVEDFYTEHELEVGGLTRASGRDAGAAAGGPADEDWSPGTSGSAAAGAAAPTQPPTQSGGAGA